MPAQQTHPHEAALALIGLFQEGESIADLQEGDFLEGGSDPFVDLINQLEFLELGADYVNDIDRMVDVTNRIGAAAAADGEALSPIWNLGEQLVLLKHLFNDFEGNINWEDDDEDDEDDANGMLAQRDSSCHQFSDGHSLAEEEEAYRRELSRPPLFTLSHCELGGYDKMCDDVCVLVCFVVSGVAPARIQRICRNIYLRN